MSTKILAHTKTYNPHDITQSGYDVDVRNNRTLRVTWRSRWQHAITGTVWIVPTPDAIQQTLDPDRDEDAPDLETAVEEFLNRHDWEDSAKRICRRAQTQKKGPDRED